MSYLVPKHRNGSVDTTADTVWEGTGVIYSILIHNTHATQILYVSFDGGKTWKQVAAGATLSLTGEKNLPIYFEDEMKLKGSAADTTYEIIWLRTPKTLEIPFDSMED